jgi:hypothetical protein
MLLSDVTVPIERRPWEGVELPSGWTLGPSGVCELKTGKEGEEKEEPVCGPLWVEGLTTSAQGDWGRLLAFLDHDQRRRELAIPAARLHEDPAILARELANLGLAIIPGKERRMLAYLASFHPTARIPSAPRLGWMDRKDGAMAFVFPDRVLTASGNERVVYQPERYSPTLATVHPSGTLQGWQAAIARPAAESDALLFALCASLTAPWLWLADGDSFIVHFWGTTSRGKTTLAQLAASVWGCGVDPTESASLSFIRRWYTTGNGLEGLAEAHSDLPLILDELGAGAHRDMAQQVYQLAGGQGKTAMSADRQLKAPRAWRTVVVSTGEVSIEGRLAEHGPVKGGLLHRALDVEVADIAAHLPESERAGFVERLKRACAEHYGTAGPAMLEAILKTYPNAQAARAAVREHLDRAVKSLATPRHSPEQRRALRRFALIGWAGVFAARHGVLPIAPERLWQAVRSIAAAWSGTTSGTDQDRILESVRAFILRHGARFQDVKLEGDVRDRAGFVDHALGRWMFTKEALREAAPGHDPTTIAKALQKAGHLFTNDVHLCPKVLTPTGRLRLYCVKDSLLLDDESSEASKTLGHVGHMGQTAPECGFQPAPASHSALGPVGQTAPVNPNPAPVPQRPKSSGASANPHSDGLCPHAPTAPVKNEAANVINDEKGF